MSQRPNRRKAIPKKLRAVTALRQDGFCHSGVQTRCPCGQKLQPGFHMQHFPPLEVRVWDEVAQDTMPPSNSPQHLFGMTPDCHRKATNHPVGPHTVLNGDRHAIDKNRRLRGEVQGRPKTNWPSRSMRSDFKPRVKDVNDI